MCVCVCVCVCVEVWLYETKYERVQGWSMREHKVLAVSEPHHSLPNSSSHHEKKKIRAQGKELGCQCLSLHSLILVRFKGS